MRGIHLGQRPTTTTPGGGASNRITFVVVDDVLYLTDPVTGYVYEAPVTFVGPTTLPSGLITASEDTLFFHYAGGTWSSPATVVEGNAPVGGSIVNDVYYVTIGSTTYAMPVVATEDIPGMPPGGDTSLVTIDGKEYLRIVFENGEVRYEEVHETPTPDASGGGGGGSSNLLNVLDFGAVGDGIANDTSAIQTAIDTGPTYIPPGTYKITTLEIPSNAMVIGAGTATKLKSTVSGTTAIIRNKSGISTRTEYVHVSDLVIEGTDGNGGTALWLNTFFHGYFSNLRLNMCRNAGNTGRGLYMENQFADSYHNTFIGLSIENCDDALVMTSTNATHSCGYNHFVALAIYQEVNSIQLLVGVGNGASYNTFTGVLLQSNGGAGIYIDITGSGNIITSVAMDAPGPGPIVRFGTPASGNRIQFNNGFEPAKFVNTSSFPNEITDIGCFCVAPGRSVTFSDPIGDLKTYWRATGTSGEVEINLGNSAGDPWRLLMTGASGQLLRLLVPGVDFPVTFDKTVGAPVEFKRSVLVPDDAYNAGTWDGNLSVPTKNAVRDALGPIASVKSFGAVGNGIANDTAAIQAAIDSGRPVYVPSGTYLISGLLGRSGPLSIRGDGENSILQMDATAAPALILGEVVPGLEGININNLSLYGHASSLGGIKCGSTTQYVAFAALDRVRIEGFTGTNAYGIQLGSVQELDINNCRVQGNYDNIHKPAVGYCCATRITGAASYIGKATNRGINLLGTIADLTIQGVVIESNVKEGVFSSGPLSHLSILDCYFEDNCGSSGTAVVNVSGTAYPNKTKLNFERNHFHFATDATKPNLKLDYVTTALITGNSFLLDTNGGVVTTANTDAVFLANKVDGGIDTTAILRALLGNITFIDYDITLGRTVIFSGPSIIKGASGLLATLQSEGGYGILKFANAGGLKSEIAGVNDEIQFYAGAGTALRATVNATGLVLAADDAYNATSWDGNLSVPTKNAVRDKIEPLVAALALVPGGADLTYSGTTLTGTGGATIAFGDLVTIDKDDSRWELVDISVAAAATGDARGLIGIAVTSSTDGAPITVLLHGLIRADANFPTLSIGAPVYASTTGDVVVTQPVTVDHVIRIIGHALTADQILFRPDSTWSTHT